MKHHKCQNQFIVVGIIAISLCIVFGVVVWGKVGLASKDSEGTHTKQVTRGDDTNISKKDSTEYTVYIETGHGAGDDGKWDAGCSWSDGTTTYEEAEVMIPIAKSMTRYLRQSGVKVYTDADKDNNKNLKETLDFLEKNQVDAFVNLHCDWEQAERGTMPLYRTEEQKRLGDALNKGVHSVIDIPDRGAEYREDLDTLNSEQPNCPAVLFETGSIRGDNEILTEQYDEYGKGLAKGMCDYLGIQLIL